MTGGEDPETHQGTSECNRSPELKTKKSIFVRLKNLYPQCLAALAVWLITLELGIMIVWSSPYLAQLTVPDSPLPLTLTEASWVASLLYIGRIIGAILGTYLVNEYGSRKTVLKTAAPMALGWILTYCATSPAYLYAARISLGIGFGLGYSGFALYLGEVAAPRIRGTLVSFAILGGSYGNLLVSFTGANMSMQHTSIMYFVPCVCIMILLLYLPDSPHHLAKLGKLDEARKSLIWYRHSEDIDQELDGIVVYVKASTASSFREKLGEFRKPHVRNATILVMMLFAFMQLSGLNNVMFYMEIILKNAHLDMIEPSLAVTYAIIASIVTGNLCVGLYDKFGRRLLLIMSSVNVSLSLAGLGAHFTLESAGVQWAGSQWLPLLSIFAFITNFVVGLASIPSIVSSEVYSADIKPVAACMANLTAAAAAFLTSKAYQPMVDAYGEAFVFFTHAAITIMIVPFALIFMPETKGKSLQQIQDLLMKKS
ncbi:facilitated trehalose transporter Tret1-like isoform X1 [Trichogramma pretiosum]|uniref:facilitated trehalose transporter Tret1-like isoform X1 n=1 Tax=Trichogramma pretiosum TaxID=7493 RepID=UPI0006C98C24|nr:facilitated trehalose transporter Tret1-like isoform X1 [Trichogramma pretiosum]